jgi:hypothetical protein
MTPQALQAHLDELRSIIDDAQEDPHQVDAPRAVLSQVLWRLRMLYRVATDTNPWPENGADATPAKPKRTRKRTLIRVGQRLHNWEGTPGYVALNSQGKSVHVSGETFQIHWTDGEGNVEDSQTLSLEQFEYEGITWGRGVMPWAR